MATCPVCGDSGFVVVKESVTRGVSPPDSKKKPEVIMSSFQRCKCGISPSKRLDQIANTLKG